MNNLCTNCQRWAAVVSLASGPERTFVQLLTFAVFRTKTATWKATVNPFIRQLLQKIQIF